MNELVRRTLINAVQTSLISLGGYLVGQGWLTTGQVTDAAMALAPILVAVGWGLYGMLKLMVEREIGKSMQSGAAQVNVHAAVEDTTIGQKIRIASNVQ